METEWEIITNATLPPEGIMVETKIDDAKGVRNEQRLCRRGRLWFTGLDGNAMYVYYTPTHWRRVVTKTGS